MSDDIYDHNKLLTFIKNNKIKNLLLGNGYCLSHPELKNSFKWNSKNTISNFTKEIDEIFIDENKTDCPETNFLKKVRLYALKTIIINYVKKFNVLIKNNGAEENLKFSDWYRNYHKNSNYFSTTILQEFDSIFTVNYDPLLYFELLDLDSFADGFGKDFIGQEKIVARLNDKGGKKIYFIHGSWFIKIDKESNNLRKINFSTDSNDTLKSLFKEDNIVPSFVLEDRNFVKESIINSHPYLKHCKEKLENFSGKILILGMSFNNDDHIIEYLKHNTSNSREIYATYHSNDDKNKLTKKLKGIPGFKKLIKVSDNATWEKVKPLDLNK